MMEVSEVLHKYQVYPSSHPQFKPAKIGKGPDLVIVHSLILKL